MSENSRCPRCGRHCELNEPHCNREKEYVRTGIAERGPVKSIGHTANYNTLDTNNKLIMNLRDLGHMIRFLFEGKGSQKRILIILNEAGSMTQRKLTERLSIQPGSASEVIGKLEKTGLIQRKLNQTDRRTADVQLTEEGRIQAEDAVRQRKIRHQEMFSCLSAEEKDTLLALIEKLNTDWDNRYRENNKACSLHKQHGRHY